MNAPKTNASNERDAKMAFRVLTGPRDAEWHDTACELLDSGPDYGFERDENGQTKDPRDVFEVAGRILGYCAGLVEWKPEE